MLSPKEEDLLLVKRFQEGDARAFDELVVRYQGKVYMNAYAMVNNPQDARELAQEVFIRVHRHLHSFEGTASFYTWVYRITRNICIDFYRKAKMRKAEYNDARAHGTEPEESIFPVVSSASRETPTGRLLREELRRKIQDAMDKLSEKHREVLILRELDGLSYQEIADIAGVSIGTVMSRLFHARKNMQSRLAPYLGRAVSEGG